MNLCAPLVLAVGVVAALLGLGCGGTAASSPTGAAGGSAGASTDDRASDDRAASDRAPLPESPATETPPPPETSGSAAVDDEEVLDGTNIGSFNDYPPQTIDASWAGSYGVEQGGAVVVFILRHANGQWRFERRHSEPGEPTNRVRGTLELADGVLSASDGSVTVRGSDRGVLVRERDVTDILPPGMWVFYYRD